MTERRTMITAKSSSLIFECVACNKPVTGDAGWLHVDLSETRRVELAVADWNEQNPGPVRSGAALVLDYPEPAQWQVHHAECDPDGEDHDCYWFYVGRCNTWPKLVNWTAHLMGKSWFEHTNWRELLERLTAEVDA